MDFISKNLRHIDTIITLIFFNIIIYMIVAIINMEINPFKLPLYNNSDLIIQLFLSNCAVYYIKYNFFTDKVNPK